MIAFVLSYSQAFIFHALLFVYRPPLDTPSDTSLSYTHCDLNPSRSMIILLWITILYYTFIYRYCTLCCTGIDIALYRTLYMILLRSCLFSRTSRWTSRAALLASAHHDDNNTNSPPSSSLSFSIS